MARQNWQETLADLIEKQEKLCGCLMAPLKYLLMGMFFWFTLGLIMCPEAVDTAANIVPPP